MSKSRADNQAEQKARLKAVLDREWGDSRSSEPIPPEPVPPEPVSSEPVRSKPVKKGRPRKYSSLEDAYDANLVNSTTHILRASRAARDIAPCPDVQDRSRRERACGDLEFFLRYYFPGTFRRDFSQDHLSIIARLQSVAVSGGCYAVAAPRGSGKTSLTERAALWSILAGYRRFVVIVAANESFAEQSLARLVRELECNDLLFADFPRTCYPIRRLEGQSRRCVGQLYRGERTRVILQRKRLVLPTMPGPDNEASGGVIHVGGLTGAIRGLSQVDPSGELFRPSLVLLDDPSDREAARSVVQTSERLAILNSDLLQLGGPQERIAALVKCTVIFRDDFAHQILDRSKYPSWHGETYRLIYDWPMRTDLWETYLQLRREGQKPGGDPAACTEFYRDRFEIMNEGGSPAWFERFEPGELSAIQHCYNLRQDRGEEVFASEFLNCPLDPSQDIAALNPVAIAGRTNGFERWVAPPECERLVSFIDCGRSLLWYMACGFSEAFDCAIVDYSCWPPQRVAVFDSRNASPTLEQTYPGGVEAAVHAGLSELVRRLLVREWKRSDQATLPLSRILIDAGWKDAVVRLFIRQHPNRNILTPAKGRGVGPGDSPMARWSRKPGEKYGDYWHLGLADRADHLRLLQHDTYQWKDRVASMPVRPMGQKGGITLYGDRPADHELAALHLSSEYPILTEAKGAKVNCWKLYPNRENHLFDCLIGCCVAASLEGISPLASIGGKPVERPKRERVSFAATQQAKMQKSYIGA